MTILNSTITDFAAAVVRDATIAFRGLAATGTIAPSGTVNFVERVPGEEAVVSIGYPGPFAPDAEIHPTIYALDGEVLKGPPNANLGGGRYLSIFRAHADITTVSHVHTVYLGAWSQSHRALPIRYVPVQRWTRARELPIYIDRRQAEADFILETLARDPQVPAILEANGGSTAWGRKGLLALASYIVLIDEGARFQAIAETLGGAKNYGPGVLEQQWKMSGLLKPEEALAVAAE
ncbi:class II aldolase/adducin family protein [Sphingomonas sp. LT1P40]|uniref:class II aldolase/adducin family protein n=1 Tax=Alteristakelama amylovorans TaxID=3096166 RepID=UPI002FC9ECB8